LGRFLPFVRAARFKLKTERIAPPNQQSQQTLAELIERSPFGTYVVDARFRIAMINTGSQSGAFRNVRPVIGRPFDEAMRILWPEDVAAEIIGHFRHTLETGEPYHSPQFINPRHDVNKENKQYGYYGRGSLFETKTWLAKAAKRNLISQESHAAFERDLNLLGKMLNAYIKSIGTSTGMVREDSPEWNSHDPMTND
jgi:hypothetical protein